MPLDKVKLYRYESVAAARSIPNMNEIMKGKWFLKIHLKFLKIFFQIHFYIVL